MRDSDGVTRGSLCPVMVEDIAVIPENDFIFITYFTIIILIVSFLHKHIVALAFSSSSYISHIYHTHHIIPFTIPYIIIIYVTSITIISIVIDSIMSIIITIIFIITNTNTTPIPLLLSLVTFMCTSVHHHYHYSHHIIILIAIITIIRTTDITMILMTDLAVTIMWYPVFSPHIVGEDPASDVIQNWDLRHWVRPVYCQ